MRGGDFACVGIYVIRYHRYVDFIGHLLFVHVGILWHRYEIGYVRGVKCLYVFRHVDQVINHNVAVRSRHPILIVDHNHTLLCHGIGHPYLHRVRIGEPYRHILVGCLQQLAFASKGILQFHRLTAHIIVEHVHTQAFRQQRKHLGGIFNEEVLGRLGQRRGCHVYCCNQRN